MKLGAKIGIMVGVAAILGLGGWAAMSAFPKKKDEELAPETPVTEPAAPSVSAPRPSAPKKAVTVKVAPKVTSGKGFTAPVKKVWPPKMGTKLFAKVATNGYTAPKASSTGIHKHYEKGAYVGTYLGDGGSGFAKVIVQVDTMVGTMNKTIYVKPSELTY